MMCQVMVRKLGSMRRILHVKGDVMCTMLLLLLFCLLLYIHQVVLSAGWGDKPTWKLQLHSSTSSSRTLLGTGGGKGETPERPSSPSQLPPCKPQPKSGRIQSKVQLKSKKKRRSGAPTAPSQQQPTLPTFDFKSYVRDKDNRDFRLVIDQPDKCGLDSSAAPYMLIAVKSVAADFDKRQVVRGTWGREGLFRNGLSIRTIFLLGAPKNRTGFPLWEQLLTYESQTFQDILLWDFDDTFFNLTLKETHFLKWVNSSCPNVRFIFKGDADVYVNVENILEMLQGQKSDEDFFVGDIIVNAKPIRRRNSKYYVPEFVYGVALYPNYAGGGGFVMSGYTARRLSSACDQVELFPIDDVFLGMCLQLIGLKPSRHQGFRTFGIPRPSAAPHLQTFDPCFYRELMVVHSLSVPQIWLMWNLLHDPKLSCHNRTSPTSWPFRWRRRPGGEADYADKQVFVTH